MLNGMGNATASQLAAPTPVSPGSAASRRGPATGAGPRNARLLPDALGDHATAAGDAPGRLDDTGLAPALPTAIAFAPAPCEARDIVLLAEAARILAEVRTLPEVKQFIDIAELARHWARKAHLGLEAQNTAAAISIEAQAKAGDLLRGMAEAGERHPHGRTSEVAAGNFTGPTLAELGIERTDAHRWGQVAAVPAELRGAYVVEAGSRGAEVSRTALLSYAAARQAPDHTLDAIPAMAAQPWVQVGELYVLGTHRLLVGDATDPANLARLMAGEKAALLATDPPYLVDYRADNHPESWSGSQGTNHQGWDAYSGDAAGVAFYRAFLEAAIPHLAADAAVYQWHAERRRSLVEEAWAACGLLLHQVIIWHKSRPVLGRSHFMWAHEPCAYGWQKGHEPALRPPRSASTIWEVDQRGETAGLHPTQKPVELFRRPIEYHTAPGDIVLDPFAGSGTAIVAAERTGRRAYCVEIDPAYAQAAIERWQTLTGRKAVAA
jgi:DNA modification methylase